MTTQQYIDNLNKRFQTGISREHTYPGDLQLALETLLKDVQVINEPARIACGTPLKNPKTKKSSLNNLKN